MRSSPALASAVAARSLPCRRSSSVRLAGARTASQAATRPGPVQPPVSWSASSAASWRAARLLAHGLQRLALAAVAVVRHFQAANDKSPPSSRSLNRTPAVPARGSRRPIGLGAPPVHRPLMVVKLLLPPSCLRNVRQRVPSWPVQFVGHRKYLFSGDRHVGPPLAGCML